MGGFGGLGVGLGMMMEGVSGGAVAGKKMEMAYDASKAKTAADAEYKDARISNEQSRLQIMQDRNDQTAEIQRQRADVEQRKADLSRVKMAWDISKDSPDPSKVFQMVQEKLNPDGDVLEMALEDKTDMVSLSWPGSKDSPGYSIKGHKADVEKVMELASLKPEKTQEIMKQALSAGVVSVTQLPWKPTGVDTAEANARLKKTGETEKKAPKVSDYVAGIKAIGSKYMVNTGSAFTVADDGSVKFNPAAMGASKETAYAAIKRVIASSESPDERAEAEADLANMTDYYRKIDGLLGGVKKQDKKVAAKQPANGFSEKAIRDTMKKYNMTYDQVMGELKRRGKI